MWGEMLLCSSFSRRLAEFLYCASHFFLSLITPYFISSQWVTVVGSFPTLVLLERENNAKRGCPWRQTMPCPSCSHMQDRFFEHNSQPGCRLLLFALQAFGNSASTATKVLLVLSTGIYGLGFCLDEYTNSQWCDTLRGVMHVHAFVG